MAQGGSHARQKFARAEGFGDVVIGPQFEKQHLIGNVAGSAEYNDRKCRRLSFDFFAEFATGKFRQAKVKNDYCRRHGVKTLQRRLSVILDFYTVTLGLEQVPQNLLY
jgi:hypothetical protein